MTTTAAETRLELADRLDAHAIRYANDYGYFLASDLNKAAAALRSLVNETAELREEDEDRDTRSVAVRSRDDFLIKKGLWSEYADSIPAWEKEHMDAGREEVEQTLLELRDFIADLKGHGTFSDERVLEHADNLIADADAILAHPRPVR